MYKFLQQLLSRKNSASKISGFTLIELLVAAAIAGIIVSSLLAFLVSILQTDQREQARVQTQEEVQTALDFIADDLKEAVYIYDADGIERLSTDNPPGIRDQLPEAGSGTQREPILVFWKRHFYAPEESIEYDTGTGRRGDTGTTVTRLIRDLPRGDGTGETRFVYALVAYYLRSNRNLNVNQSNSMQIIRFEFRDGIRSDCQNTDPATCNPPSVPPSAPIFRVNTDGDTTNDVNGGDTNFWIVPDQNFRRFDTGGIGSFRDRLNRWRDNTPLTVDTPTILGGYDLGGVNEAQVILDFVDDTFYTTAEDDGILNNSSIFVPIRPNNIGIPNPGGINNFFNDNADCANPSIGVGRTPPNGDVDGDNRLDIAAQRIPSAFAATTFITRANNASSFFVCVNSVQNVARVWIRGNALVRQFPNNRALRRIQPTGDPKANFLTTASVRATSRSSLNIQ